MSYWSVLPNAFPHSVIVKEADLARVLSALVAPDSSCPNGSSFAVTANCDLGKRVLWMSETSLDRCKDILKAVL